MSHQWYIIYVVSGLERTIKENILEKAAKNSMSGAFLDILIPSISVPGLKRGNKVTLNKKMMPGYMFLHMEMSDKTWHLVSTIPKVLEFLGGDHPSVISTVEIDRILRELEKQSHSSNAQHALENGDVVRILDGPFESFKGQIESIDEKENKAVVAVSIFGNSTMITLELDRIKRESL